jgi:hypothetical protein
MEISWIKLDCGIVVNHIAAAARCAWDKREAAGPWSTRLPVAVRAAPEPFAPKALCFVARSGAIV